MIKSKSATHRRLLYAGFLATALAALGAAPASSAPLPGTEVQWAPEAVSGPYGTIRSLPLRVVLTAGPEGAHGYLRLDAARSALPGTAAAPSGSSAGGGAPFLATGDVVLGISSARNAMIRGCSTIGALAEKQLTESETIVSEVTLPANGSGAVEATIDVPAWFRPLTGEAVAPRLYISEDWPSAGSSSKAETIRLPVSPITFANPVALTRVALDANSNGSTSIRRSRINSVGGRITHPEKAAKHVSLYAARLKSGKVTRARVAGARVRGSGRFTFRLRGSSLNKHSQELYVRSGVRGSKAIETSCAVSVSFKR